MESGMTDPINKVEFNNLAGQSVFIAVDGERT